MPMVGEATPGTNSFWPGVKDKRKTRAPCSISPLCKGGMASGLDPSVLSSIDASCALHPASGNAAKPAAAKPALLISVRRSTGNAWVMGGVRIMLLLFRDGRHQICLAPPNRFTPS